MWIWTELALTGRAIEKNIINKEQTDAIASQHIFIKTQLVWSVRTV